MISSVPSVKASRMASRSGRRQAHIAARRSAVGLDELQITHRLGDVDVAIAFGDEARGGVDLEGVGVAADAAVEGVQVDVVTEDVVVRVGIGVLNAAVPRGPQMHVASGGRDAADVEIPGDTEESDVTRRRGGEIAGGDLERSAAGRQDRADGIDSRQLDVPRRGDVEPRVAAVVDDGTVGGL
jgi:hypothetical protein